MKKILLGFLFCFLLSSVYSQEAEYADVVNKTGLKSALTKSIKLNPQLVAPNRATASNVIWDNGPLVNSPGTGAGGADESVLQSVSLGMNTLGFGFQTIYGNSIADDFVLTKLEKIDSIVVFGYQTGSSTTSTITEVQLRIYDGDPSLGGNLIWGDYVTNRLSSSTWSGIYRITETSQGNTDRPIMKCVCNINEEFDAGTYWLEVQMGGTLSSGPWAPPITINGETTTGNAVQYVVSWLEADDGVTYTQQGLPFLLYGKTDTVPPVTECNPIEIELYENGEYVLTPDDIKELSAGTIDNCTAYEDLILTAFPRSFECVHVGSPVSVTLTATDESGNSASCVTTVTVLDKTDPLAVCENVTVELDENGKASIFPGQVNAGNNRASVPGWARTYNGLEDGSYDACGVESLNLDKSSFYCSDLGDNTVTLIAGDPSGNTGTCQAVVTIVDNIAPTFEPIADITLEVEPGICETEIIYPEMVVNDNCEVTLTQVSGLGEDELFPLGTTTETWTVTDDAGNTAELSFDVVITTTNATPTVDKITDIEVEEDTYGIIVPTSGISGGNDCVPQDVTVKVSTTNPELVTSTSINHTSGDSASINLEFAAEMSGESEITVTVTDTENDSISETFTVFVTAVNDAPFLVTPIEDQVVNASYPLTLQLPQTLGVLFDDIDDDVLTLMLVEEGETSLPAWASFADNILTINPMIADTGCVNIVVTATDTAGASAADTFEVCVLGYPVSIGELDANVFEIKMYPNPTSGNVNIELNKSDISDIDMAVVDITGRQILRKQYSASENIRFDMSGKVSGMYFVHLNIDGKQIVKKLVVDRK